MKSETSKNARGAQDNKSAKKSNKVRANDKLPSPPQSPTPTPAQQLGKDAAAVDVEGEMSNTCPKIGSFYEFFSLSHLTPPLQCNAIFFFNSGTDFLEVLFTQLKLENKWINSQFLIIA